MDSVLEQLAADMAGKAVVGIIPQAERELFRTYNIRGIPAFILVYNSEVKQSFSGFKDKDFLADALNAYIK
jgi:hypothetical protein